MFLSAALGLVALAAQADNEALVLQSASKSYVQVPFFSTPAEMTVEAWIKTSQSSTGTIVAWKDIAADGESSMFRVQNGKLQYGEWYGYSWSEINSPENVNADVWTHVAVVRSGSQATLYVNGNQVAQSEMHSSAECTTDNLKIGALGTTWSECFNGMLDEVRIWSVARTSDEIRTNFQKELTGSENGLEGYWKFDGNANDDSSNSRDGQSNAVSYASSDIFSTEKPQLTELAFKESTSSLPVLTASMSRSGQVYWAVCLADSAAPTADELVDGSASFAASGKTVSNVAGPLSIPFSTSLLKGATYTPYAIIEASNGTRSDVAVGTTFTYQGLSCLPEGWSYTDIGTVSEAGHSVYQDSIYTIAGAGSDIWNVSDAFHYAYRAANEDIEMVARVADIVADDDWTKVGIMMRESLSPDAPHVFVCATPGEGNNRFTRTQSASSTSVTTVTPAVEWLKMVKKDGWVATYISEDGQSWQQIGMNVELLGRELPYVGFAVCGHGSGMAKAMFDNVTISQPADTLSLSDRGIYFDKKKYVPTPIPEFEDIRSALPRPVLTDNPEWVDMYYKAWQIGFSHIKSPADGSPLVSNFYDENFDSHIFQWDMLFMTIFGRYADHVFPGIESLDNFYCRQHVSGCITRCLTEATGEDNGDEDSDNIINPPLFSWAELLNYRFTADTVRLRRVLPVLEKYCEFVELKRRGDDTPHKLYWNNGQASGMDNLPRDIGRENLHHADDHQGWADMSSQMVIQYRSMAEICSILADAETDDASRQTYLSKHALYNERAEAIGELMNQWLWNAEDGLYYDVDTLGVQTGWKTIACFWPLLAGVTDAVQDSALVKNLKDPNSFWRDNVFPALAADEEYYSPRGGYWCGGVWAPSNYAVIKGLENKNIDDFAHIATLRYLRAVYDVYEQTGTFWENYAPELSNGRYNHGTDESDYNPCRSDFVGWTGLAPISLLIENVLGFRVDGPDNRLDFDLRRLDRHGIEGLHFAGITTSVVVEKRDDTNAPVQLTVTTDKPYKLVVHRDKLVEEINVPEGTHSFELNAISTGIAKTENGKGLEFDYDHKTQAVSVEAKEQAYDVNLYDLGCTRIVTGKSDKGGKCKLDVSALPHGVYIVNVKLGEENYSRKICVN